MLIARRSALASHLWHGQRSSTRVAGRSPAFSGADGFVAEYKLAGIKLDERLSSELRDWYQRELSSTDVAASGLSGPGAVSSKELPALERRRPGTLQLTVLWDLDSIKPFTQQHQHQAPPPEGPSRAATSVSGGGGRVSRLAAAGLTAASSPDLIGALEQLCRTLQQYGTVHAVHLFLRESSLAKAPALRRQVAQLSTWVESEAAEEEGQGAAEAVAEAEAQGAQVASGAEGRRHVAKSSGQDVAGRSAAAAGAPSAGSGGAVGGPKGAKRRSPLPTAPAHDCPMCTSTYPTRLALLRHFASAHQAPVLAATATDPRVQIMWTRGRAVMLPVASDADAGAGTQPDAGDEGLRASDDGEGQGTRPERALVSPQEFAHARELLMRGRHLDDLLAAAPVTITPVPTPGAAGPSGAAAASQARGTARGASAAGGGALAAPGVRLHLLPAGQAAEDVAAAVFRSAEEVASAKAVASQANTARAGRGAAQAPGRQRSGSRGSVDAEPPPACLCIVSDAEGLDQVLASVQRRDVQTIAVTRTARVAADVSLRWWAVQGGEYRLESGGGRR